VEQLATKMDAMEEYINQNFGSDWAVTEKTRGSPYYRANGRAGGIPSIGRLCLLRCGHR